MQKILILGAKGMLGQELVRVYNDGMYDVTAWDREDIDVTDFDVLHQKINDLWPDVIYNAVAYNAVDACENDDEYIIADQLNGVFPGELAKIAKNLDATLVHYSTDYVFDGERPMYPEGKNPGCCGNGCSGCMYKGPEDTLEYFAYHEGDVPRPISRYGMTKLHGEQAIEKNMNNYYVIRLSKLFGKPATSIAGKKSFFDLMLDLGKKNDEVKAVNGEISKFTYAPDLAYESKRIVDAHLSYGIYHVANEGAATWYDGAVALYELAGLKTRIIPVSSDTFPRLAKRPSSSVLKVTKIPPMRHYRDALREYLNEQK